MYLKPSEIYFSQNSINNYFDSKSSHSRTRIGDTLDDICEGRCSAYSIPTISVMKRSGKWITADNRRLWVFRQLERLGKCSTIEVMEIDHIPDAKMTSYGGAYDVRVRGGGDPGGVWHSRNSNYSDSWCAIL